ncbi:hypothetical protein AB5J62_00365 [Amycolatopsis sp. cg5]|uniref:hypothetical protein n=1 Tax=Amycolatopsis sp. cg5 TaxID=3238802 RepID=UPI0035266013
MTTATSGAGIFDTYSGLVDSITAESENEGMQVCNVAISAASAVVDTVGAAMDPLGAVLNAGVGWMLEHISFLREPLDALLGNPDEINANVDQLKSAAAEMKTIAQEHREDLKAVAEWEGDAADKYRDSLTQMAEELESLGKTLDGTAAIAGISGMLVTTLRGIVFGLISNVIAELIRDALIAAASAVVTFGSSVAAFLGVASARAAATAAKISGKITKLLSGFARQGTRLAKLIQAMEKITQGLDRFATVGGLAMGAYDAVKPYDIAPAGE